VDFQRDLQPGDRIEALYEVHLARDGAVAKTGEVLAARFAVKGGELALYRFRLPDGSVDWFDARGESVRKALLKTPVDGARLSSRFGLRRHPILGYSMMHRGADFAAPTGTPVMAAGDGVVELAGVNGAYGNYVRLRHDERRRTAYAHLSRFAEGLRPGRRVRQGQTIGYVGSTGRSTGPHLHYEVLIDGEQVDPMSLQLPTGRKLEGRLLADFQRARSELDRRLNAAASPSRTASAAG
jgi:murein DD-endopeptidase MepM/ murein hydrolase activator NlpD